MSKRLTNEQVNERIKNLFIENVELAGDYINKRTPVLLHCLDCG